MQEEQRKMMQEYRNKMGITQNAYANDYKSNNIKTANAVNYTDYTFSNDNNDNLIDFDDLTSDLEKYMTSDMNIYNTDLNLQTPEDSMDKQYNEISGSNGALWVSENEKSINSGIIDQQSGLMASDGDVWNNFQKLN